MKAEGIGNEHLWELFFQMIWRLRQRMSENCKEEQENGRNLLNGAVCVSVGRSDSCCVQQAGREGTGYLH